MDDAEAHEPAVVAPVSKGPLGDLVAAHFQRVEIAMLGRVLTTTLAGALPPAMVRVERRRTFLERLRRRPGQPIGVSVISGDRMLTFRAPAVGLTEASVSHFVRGVVLSTEAVPVQDWLTMLGALLAEATTNDKATQLALERALVNP